MEKSIESLGKRIKNDLAGGIEFEKGTFEGKTTKVYCNIYDFDKIMTELYTEEAIVNYLNEMLNKEIEKIEQEEGVKCKMFVTGAGLNLLFNN